MNTHPLANIILDIKIGKINGSYTVNKPSLLLVALSMCYQDGSRLAPFFLYEQLVSKISNVLGQKINTCYPFGRLVSDGIWELESSINLSLKDSGDLYRSELISNTVKGGFTNAVYCSLVNEKSVVLDIVNQLLQRYFPMEQHAALCAAVGLPQELGEVRDIWDGDHAVTSAPTPPVNPAYPSQEDAVDSVHNGFIAYLNSLHNLGAGGANALAETQALNRYFALLYEPFPIVGAVLSALRDGVNRVVVLTGHAGDGKSTVALDVFKHLRGLPPNDPLQQPLAERETTESPVGPVTIVKDMSELGAEIRLQWLADAFGKPGSWLIISNTGPLLDSLDKYAKQHDIADDIESDLLAKIDETYADGVLDAHILHGFPKTLVIFNLTRLDNVALGARVLGKMLNHPAWADCAGCPAEVACPLQLNRRALLSLGVVAEDRVRWVYQRLTHYEQRLTLRQMLAHLALALTGGMDCRQAQRHVEDSTAEGSEKGVYGLAEIMFSEGFFGYRNGKPWDKALGLRAVALARRLVAGGPVAVDYERQLLRIGAEGVAWAGVPEPLAGLTRCWGAKATNAAGVRWRFALRRMLYVFCLPNGQGTSANLFFDTFLRSPKLRDFDHWQSRQQLTLDYSGKNNLRKACLRVLLECYSGFSVGQFPDHDRLYLSLRRPDRAVAQPTQWVVASLPFDEFELGFDPVQRLPELTYRQGKAVLKLGLPLLDYIHARDAGELGGELAQIHWTQLEAFRAEMLSAETKVKAPEKITLLRAGIDGEVHLHRYILDPEHHTLEVDH
jgi:hypothetical protein